MPQTGETLYFPHTSQASNGLRHLYQRVESGALPTIPTKEVLRRNAQEKTARYPHGKRVGPYLLSKTIGEGSFAKVKEALHGVVGEKVAIKVIDKKIVREDAYLRKNMRREAGLLQSLRHHPNIITLYEVMETDNNFYMVLELCTGGALLDRICSEKCLLEAEARRYVRQIVSAVDHMHQAGILHRDLKVENLLLDSNNNIKIIDFGLSNMMSTSHGNMRAEFRATQCGSPAYAAPEIMANKKYGAKVDVWSIGVNTFAMMAGCLPFTVEPFNIKLLLKKINNREMADIPSHLSHGCKDFIRKLLQPDPRLRYSIKDAMNHPWLVADKMTTTRLRSPSPPPNGRISRMELENDILEYIWTNMGYNINHVTNSVISKRADEYSAIYYLLLRKRDRQHLKMLKKLEGVVDADVEDTKDSGISGPKLYDEATALELAGRKNGSLHFKMALLLEQETEADTTECSSPDEEKTEIESTNQNDQDEIHVTPSSNNQRQARDLKSDSRSTTHTSPRNHSFHSNMNALRYIRSKTSETENIKAEWKETSKKVADNISNKIRPMTRVTNTIHKPTIAHKVNLTFKQSDTPTENFADHFNYRRKNRENQTKWSLAPAYIPNHSSNRKTIPNQTWRQSESIDSLNLQRRIVGLKITPRLISVDKEMPSNPDHEEAIATVKNTTNIHHPPPQDCEITNKRRQLKISKRKSIDNIILRRPTRVLKRTSTDIKTLTRIPGKPTTPNGSGTQGNTTRKVSCVATNQKRRGSRDKNKCQKRKKPLSCSGNTVDTADGCVEKCDKDLTVQVDPQVVCPTQATPEDAVKKVAKTIKPPKASLTNKKLICNAISAETDV